ncbi:helix-turn-helix domain-containing protein [Treponema pedis]|uniref:helix-turn-helix domain-containing protein n=1 Tax=Treponema pedis TaxID=409322 RepID=UPI002091A149|nr:helix-turn-helix transcriptional regulator [Treponema pedis]
MNYDFTAILAKNIRKIRNKLNISQMELALRAGVSIAFINSIENRTKSGFQTKNFNQAEPPL